MRTLRFDEFVFRLDGATLTACSDTEPLSFPEACTIALDAIEGVVLFTAESAIEIASTEYFEGGSMTVELLLVWARERGAETVARDPALWRRLDRIRRRLSSSTVFSRNQTRGILP